MAAVHVGHASDEIIPFPNRILRAATCEKHNASSEHVGALYKLSLVKCLRIIYHIIWCKYCEM